jgi:light-regulated signal transduction histidine kinase (bacteriophytochrome)
VSIEENSAVISAGPLPRVFVAETHLQQLFQNLLSNSIKYRSEKPPHIQVSARPLEGYYLFSVRDNGIGIEPKHFEQVFGLFKRLHGRREYPGTGLGLAICRRIVEVYGGTISVESEPGQGATFLFTLPDTQRTTGAVESHSRTK